jgi:hypothetical protein
MHRTEHARLKLLIGLSLVFGASAATMGGMLASLEGGGGPEPRRGPPHLAAPGSCDRRDGAGEWTCPGPVLRTT